MAKNEVKIDELAEIYRAQGYGIKESIIKAEKFLREWGSYTRKERRKEERIRKYEIVMSPEEIVKAKIGKRNKKSNRRYGGED